MGHDPVSGPGPGTFERVQTRAVPPVSPLEGADPAFAAGSPFHRSPERWSVLDGAAGGAGFALPRDDDVADVAVGQLLIDGRLAVAAVGGHGPRHPAGPLDDPVDRRRPLDRKSTRLNS